MTRRTMRASGGLSVRQSLPVHPALPYNVHVGQQTDDIACMSRSLCTYTHPELEAGDTRRPCRSLKELKQLLAASRQLHFCDICLDGRKVLNCRIC